MNPIFQKLSKVWDAMRPQNRIIDRTAIGPDMQPLGEVSDGKSGKDLKLLAPPTWYQGHKHGEAHEQRQAQKQRQGQEQKPAKQYRPSVLPGENPAPPLQQSRLAERIAREKLRLPALHHHDALEKLRFGDITARIDTLLELEERSVDAPGEVRLITATVAAYILEHTKSSTQNRPGPDVMVALAILCRLLNANFPSQTTISLDKANFAGLEMVDADFSRLSMAEVNFTGADLRGANFNGVNLRGAVFRNAQLAGACFDNSSIRHTIFDGALLSDAEFGAARFAQAGNFDPTQLLATSFAPHLPPILPPGYSPGIIGLYPGSSQFSSTGTPTL